MEEWEVDFHWLKVRHFVKESMAADTMPDLKGVLFLIGVQELGEFKETFTKEEKRDLMHIAVCSLLEEDGFYEFIGRDHDGWPHWKNTKKLQKDTTAAQELLLKQKIIKYFSDQN